MRRDGDDPELIAGGAVAPNNAIGAGCSILSVSLEDILSLGSAFPQIFMRLEAWMAQIAFHHRQGFSNRLPDTRLPGIGFQGAALLRRLVRIADLKTGQSSRGSSAYLARLGILTILPSASCLMPRRTDAKALGFW